MVQRLLDQLEATRTSCHLLVVGLDDSSDAWTGRAHTAAISAARLWGARAVRQCRRVEYVFPWEAHADARPGVGGRCFGM
eukprot:8666109-Lingulodinium_polyedra.AAC.1